MKKSLKALFLFFAFILIFVFSVVCFAQEAVPSDGFSSDVSFLQEEDRIPSRDWTYHKLDDIQTQYASRFNYRYDIVLQKVKNFVVKATITWETASETPEWNYTGCGFIFRKKGHDFMQASIYADGYTRMTGRKGMTPLSYRKNQFALFSQTGTHDVVLSVSGSRMTMMVDGEIIMERLNVALTEPGDFGFYTGSGTNYDYGTRCTYSNIELYSWD